LLLDLDQPGASDEIERAWDEEIRARVKTVDERRAVGVPYEEIEKEMAAISFTTIISFFRPHNRN
jgi:hypothetical protein